MNLRDIAVARLFSQQLVASKFTSVKAVVGWMGAMQAQDYQMVRLAVGVRLPGTTDRQVSAAIDRGELLRTHLLRPTWHLVTADDLPWLLALTAPQIKAKMKSRHKSLGLTEAIFAHSNTLIEDALRGGVHLHFDDLAARLAAAGITTGDNRAYHMVVWAELDGIVCSGAAKDGKPTYALLRERIQSPGSLSKEDALARIAIKYFSSHGPASLQDFVWWAGLSIGAAKQAIEIAKPQLVSVKVGSQTCWMADAAPMPLSQGEFVCLLPAYDEFIIGYNDRSASLPDEHLNRAISSNGVFRPSILVDGQVVGIWKREVKQDKIIVVTDLFARLSPSTMDLVEREAVRLGMFYDKQLELQHH